MEESGKYGQTSSDSSALYGLMGMLTSRQAKSLRFFSSPATSWKLFVTRKERRQP